MNLDKHDFWVSVITGIVGLVVGLILVAISGG